MKPMRWDVLFAGVLAEESKIFLNSNESLQFYIKIISSPPADFPFDTKQVAGFGSDLEMSCGFFDNDSLLIQERVEKLREFLGKYILFFKVKESNGHYKAVDLQVLRRNDDYSKELTLQPIPIFSETGTKKTQRQFEEQLVNKRQIGLNQYVSREKDDSPSIVVWKESEEDYVAYGDFSSHVYHHIQGFKLEYKNEIHKLSMPFEAILDAYICEQVMFMNNEDYTELYDSLISKGEVMELPETTEVFEETEDVQIGKGTSSTTAGDDKEMEFMERFKLEAQRMGLYYTDKDLFNFHIAMKTRSLVILSGMSGTGKSRLVQCYANALAFKSSQLHFIPVSPSWQDDTDVIGYLDTLNNLYRPGDSGLVNALITAQADENDDSLYIICFDEMNLARVEHYFSKFLSVLEQDVSQRSLTLYNDEFETRLYNREQYKSSIPIKNNVIFVGTVNEDESTYQFSDKVLDRSNVINLDVVPYMNIKQMDENRRKVLSEMDDTKTIVSYREYDSFRKKNRELDINEDESTFLWEFHLLLKECNRNLGIGWRIVRQISNYLNNIPVQSPFTREEAFDMQLVQRVITKIRGSEEQLQELLGKYNPETKTVNEENSSLLKLLKALPDTYKMEQTKKLLVGKARELRLYGHTL